MMRYVTSKEMKEIDRVAQEEYGIPSAVLMENAGRVFAEEILKDFKNSKVYIFSGRGNNGGDGFVVAEHLNKSGIDVTVHILGHAVDIKNTDPLLNLKRIKKLGITLKEITSEKDVTLLKSNFRCNLIVDAIFGIGFKGKLQNEIESLVSFLNSTNKPIYSLDVPSGFNATTGKVEGTCIIANKTITFGLPKKGFLEKSTNSYIGQLVVKNIGFPKKLLK